MSIMKKLFTAMIAASMLVGTTLTASAASETAISQGKSYTITSESPIDNAYPNFKTQDTGKLTDGKKGGSSYTDSAYEHLYRGTNQIFTVDLGEVMAVTRATIGQNQILGGGIYFSREIYLSVSEDGENFAPVGENIDQNRLTSFANGRREFEVKAENAPVRARYVRVIFTGDVFVYCDEITVFGNTDPGTARKAEVKQPEADKGFAGAVDGINHICLMYSGEYYQGAVSAIGKISAQQLLPYFAYIDSARKVAGSMFEGMLWLPLQPGTQSGDVTNTYSFGKKTGFEYFLNATLGLESGMNLKALDSVVGENKQAAGYAADYKYPVYIAVPYIARSNTPFGVIDGTTVAPNSLENRKKIVDWFVDLAAESFGSAGFENIKLNGFYWYNESVSYSTGGVEEISLIKYFNSNTQSKGYSTTWIPYYCAPGYHTANELGFSAAVVQSGYAFKQADNSEIGDAFPETIDDVAKMANKYGIGMEIEASSFSGEFFSRYYKYLQGAYAAGHMQDGLFMYYQGGGPGVFYAASGSAASSEPRVAYELTKKFIDGEFTSNPPVIAKNQTLLMKTRTKTSGKLLIEDTDSAPGQLKLASVDKSEDINISLDGSGFIILNAKETDFMGETSFSFSVTDGYNLSETTEVKVLVVDDCAAVGRVGGSLKNNFSVIYNEGETTGTDEAAYEICVGADGKIISCGGNNNAIPKGGYVVASSGTQQEYFKNHSVVGASVTYDAVTGNLYIASEADPQTSQGDTSEQNSEPTASEPTASESSGGGKGIGNLILPIIAGVLVAGAIAAAFIFLRKKKA